MKLDFVHRAKACFTERKYHEAAALCREGLETDPDNLEGQVVLDMALVAIERFIQIVSEMTSTVEAEPTNVKALLNLGLALECLGETERSQDIRFRARRLDIHAPLLSEFLEPDGDPPGAAATPKPSSRTPEVTVTPRAGARRRSKTARATESEAPTPLVNPSPRDDGHASALDAGSANPELPEIPDDIELDEIGQHLKDKVSWHPFDTSPPVPIRDSYYSPLPLDTIEYDTDMNAADAGSPGILDGVDLEIPEDLEATELQEPDLGGLLDELTERAENGNASAPLHRFDTWDPPPSDDSRPTPSPIPVRNAVEESGRRARTRKFRRCSTSPDVHRKANAMLDFSYLYQRLKTGGGDEVWRIEEELRDVAERYPGTPLERRKLASLSSWWRSRAYLLARGDDEWPPCRILVQLAVEHADHSPLTISAESWITKGYQSAIWLRPRTRPPKPLDHACLAAVDVGQAVIDLAVDGEGRTAIALTSDAGSSREGQPCRRLFTVDLVSLRATPLEVDPASVVDASDLNALLEGEPTQLVGSRIPSIQGLSPNRSLSAVIVERVGVHNPEIAHKPEPVALLNDGHRVVSGTHDGIVRVWDLDTLTGTISKPWEDTWARQVIDRARKYVEHELTDGWGGWTSRQLVADRRTGSGAWDDEGLHRQTNLELGDFMNWGLENIAFRFVSPCQVSLIQREPRRHLAAWFSRVPLLRLRSEDAMCAPDVWTVRKDGYLVLETQSGLALALQVMRGDQVIDPVQLDTIRGSGPPQPPPWLVSTPTPSRPASPRRDD